MSFPLPEPTPLSKPYWDALSDGRLTFQRCRNVSTTHGCLRARNARSALQPNGIGRRRPARAG